MKKTKKVFIIILSILIAVTSLVAYASGMIRLGVLNPWVYSNFMPTLNAYDSMYDSFTDYLLEPIKAMDVPEEIQGVPEDLVASGIPKKDFNQQVGKAIGGGLGWLLYNHDDVELPIKYFAQSLNETIANDERVINSETNIKATMEAIVGAKIEIFVPSNEYEQTFRGYVYYMLTGGNQQFMDTYDYWVDVFFYYYGIRLSIITILSFAVLVLLTLALILITKESRKIPIRLAKVLCIVYGVINVFVAALLFFAPWVAQLSNSLSGYAKYLEYARGLTNSFGVLALVYALVLFIVALGLGIMQKNIAKTDKNNKEKI